MFIQNDGVRGVEILGETGGDQTFIANNEMGQEGQSCLAISFSVKP